MSNDTAQQIQISPKAKLLNEVAGKLQDLLTKQAEALPKNFNQTRFLQNCLTVLNDTKDIEKCTPISVARTMIKGAYLGLDFFRRECYAIPYGDQLNFQTDYKGEIKLVNQHSVEKLKDIYAKIVREGDDLQIYVQDGQQYVNFRPLPFNDGKIVGAFAVALFHSGAMICDQMSIAQLEQTRKDFSKVPNGPAYTKSLGEMYKKIVLRRVCKLIPLDFETLEQEAAHQEGTDGIIQTEGQVIDTTAEEVKDPFGKVDPAVEIQKEAERKLRYDLKAKYPNEEEWQISARIKDMSGVAK